MKLVYMSVGFASPNFLDASTLTEEDSHQRL
jgi:hypothetical protein